MSDVEQAIVDGDLTTGNFTIQASLPQGKSITMSGYVFAKNTQEEISKQIDTFHDVIDRQRARAEIPELEARLDVKFAELRNHKDHVESIIKARQKILDETANGVRLSSVKKKAVDDNQSVIDNMMTSIAKLEKDIDKGLDAIKTAKEKVA